MMNEANPVGSWPFQAQVLEPQEISDLCLYSLNLEKQLQVLNLTLPSLLPSVSTFYPYFFLSACFIRHNFFLLELVNPHNVFWVSHHLLISLDLEIPQDALSFILQTWRYLPPWLWYFQLPLNIDAPAKSILATWLYAHRTCLHFTDCSDVLECLGAIFAQLTPGVFSGVIDPNFYCSSTNIISG